MNLTADSRNLTWAVTPISDEFGSYTFQDYCGKTPGLSCLNNISYTSLPRLSSIKNTLKTRTSPMLEGTLGPASLVFGLKALTSCGREKKNSFKKLLLFSRPLTVYF